MLVHYWHVNPPFANAFHNLPTMAQLSVLLGKNLPYANLHWEEVVFCSYFVPIRENFVLQKRHNIIASNIIFIRSKLLSMPWRSTHTRSWQINTSHTVKQNRIDLKHDDCTNCGFKLVIFQVFLHFLVLIDDFEKPVCLSSQTTIQDVEKMHEHQKRKDEIQMLCFITKVTHTFSKLTNLNNFLSFIKDKVSHP